VLGQPLVQDPQATVPFCELPFVKTARASWFKLIKVQAPIPFKDRVPLQVTAYDLGLLWTAMSEVTLLDKRNSLIIGLSLQAWARPDDVYKVLMDKTVFVGEPGDTKFEAWVAFVNRKPVQDNVVVYQRVPAASNLKYCLARRLYDWLLVLDSAKQRSFLTPDLQFLDGRGELQQGYRLWHKIPLLKDAVLGTTPKVVSSSSSVVKASTVTKVYQHFMDSVQEKWPASTLGARGYDTRSLSASHTANFLQLLSPSSPEASVLLGKGNWKNFETFENNYWRRRTYFNSLPAHKWQSVCVSDFISMKPTLNPPGSSAHTSSDRALPPFLSTQQPSVPATARSSEWSFPKPEDDFELVPLELLPSQDTSLKLVLKKRRVQTPSSSVDTS
jgi:hypothetical protein